MLVIKILTTLFIVVHVAGNTSHEHAIDINKNIVEKQLINPWIFIKYGLDKTYSGEGTKTNFLIRSLKKEKASIKNLKLGSTVKGTIKPSGLFGLKPNSFFTHYKRQDEQYEKTKCFGVCATLTQIWNALKTILYS